MKVTKTYVERVVKPAVMRLVKGREEYGHFARLFHDDFKIGPFGVDAAGVVRGRERSCGLGLMVDPTVARWTTRPGGVTLDVLDPISGGPLNRYFLRAVDDKLEAV